MSTYKAGKNRINSQKKEGTDIICGKCIFPLNGSTSESESIIMESDYMGDKVRFELNKDDSPYEEHGDGSKYARVIIGSQMIIWIDKKDIFNFDKALYDLLSKFII